MKYDAISYAPSKPFHSEADGNEFENDVYCLSFDKGAITLHLKLRYLDALMGDTPREQRQIRKWNFYTSHLNCIYLLLDGFVTRDLKIPPYFDIEEITTKNTSVVSSSESKTWLDPNREFLLLPTQPLLIPKQILQAVNLAFSKLILDFERVTVLSELTKGLAAYKSGDFTTSLVLAWFLLERFIEIRWVRYLEIENRELENGQKRINADRRKSLNDPRSYPISVKLQILELAQKISLKLFFDLDLLRAKRNDIVHPKKIEKGNSKARNDIESCVLAFELLEQFLETDFDIRLILNKSFSHLGVFDR